MKHSHPQHLGMEITLWDGRKGKVVKVLDTKYRVLVLKSASYERYWIPLESLRWTKANQLFEVEPALHKKLCQLQYCGPNLDGLVVKVSGPKDQNGMYHILYATGCGNSVPARCLKALDKDNGVIQISSTTGKCVCNACKGEFNSEDMNLYYTVVRDKMITGGVCGVCNKLISPFLTSIMSTSDVEVPTTTKGSTNPIGFHPIRVFDTKNLITLNSEVKASLEELAKRFELSLVEAHKQIRPTAMEYTVTVKLPSDNPAPKLSGELTKLKGLKKK